MPQRQVKFVPGHYYHIYNRGHNRELIFFERDNYFYFLVLLRQYFTADKIDIIAYCLMPNHYHLLVYLKTEKISEIMQPFTVAYAKAINKRYERIGSLFQGKFQAILVDKDDYLLYLTRYIHLNPVAANLVKNPQEWEFSSYREYIGTRAGNLPNTTIARSIFNTPIAYQEFVESDQVIDQQILHLTLDF